MPLNWRTVKRFVWVLCQGPQQLHNARNQWNRTLDWQFENRVAEGSVCNALLCGICDGGINCPERMLSFFSAHEIWQVPFVF